MQQCIYLGHRAHDSTCPARGDALPGGSGWHDARYLVSDHQGLPRRVVARQGADDHAVPLAQAGQEEGASSMTPAPPTWWPRACGGAGELDPPLYWLAL